jgi:Mor family transcriptional regulator
MLKTPFLIHELSPETIINIIDDYLIQKVKVDDIKKNYKISHQTLYKIFEQCGLGRKRKHTNTYFSQEIQQQVIDDYNNEVPMRALVKKYGISYGSVCRIVEKCKDRNTGAKRLALKHEKLLEYYKQNKSIRFICNKLNMDGRDVTEVLTAAGIDVRPVEFYSRENTLNEDYFETIDSFDKAQMLGMIQGDGSVSKTGNHLKLGLSDTDYAWLEWFNKCLDSNATITSYKGKSIYNKKLSKTYQQSPHSCVDVSSAKLQKDLAKYGIIPNKTYKNCPLPDESLIPLKYMCGYFLGFIESDGSINYKENLVYSKRTKKKDLPSRYFNCIMLSQPLMARQIVEFFKKHLDIHVCSTALKGYGNDLHRLSIHRIADMVKLYHFLYDDATFVMKRKHDIFINFMNYAKTRGHDIGTLRNFDSIE